MAKTERGMALPRSTRETQARAAWKSALKTAAMTSKIDEKAIRKFSWEKQGD